MKQDVWDKGTQNLGGGQLPLPYPWTWLSAIVVVRRRYRCLAPTVNDSFTVQRSLLLHVPLPVECSMAVR